MKKVILLLACGAIGVSANAQERRASILNVTNDNSTAKRNAQIDGNNLTPGSTNANAKTTTGPGGSRWYNFVDSILEMNTTAVASVGGSTLTLWNDTTAVVGYDNSGTPTYFINTWTSVGLSLNPMYSAWNDATVFPHRIKVTNADSYTIDSVAIFGSYVRPVIAGTYTDMLRISLVYGDGTSASDLPGYYFTGMTSKYGIDTVRFADMLHDSLNNQAGVTTPPGSIHSYTFSLTAADTATNFGQVYPVNFVVPAAKFTSLSLGFKSGDATFTSFDTIAYADGTNKRGNFSSLITYALDPTGTVPAFPPYYLADQNVGFFKREGSGDAGWGGNYIPNWAWSNTMTGGASFLQYPYIWFHVKCTSCALTSPFPGSVSSVYNDKDISVSPNPANSELNISFKFTNTENVSISLTNMVGQVVATQDMGKVNSGKAVFNTSALPQGIYVYTVNINGERSTGRVVVSH